MPFLKAVLLSASLLLSGCERQTESDPVILSLDDQVVRRSDFDRHVADLETRGGIRLDPAVRKAMVEPFLEQQVLVMEARSQGLLRGTGSSEEQQTAVARLLSQRGVSGDVTTEEVRAYYAAHRAEFTQPQRVTLRQVLVSTANEARDVRRRAQDDPKQFDLLARSRSRAPEAGAGGLMGTFARGELPTELEGPAFQLQPGELSDVIESPLGFHVLRIESRDDARDTPLPEAEAAIRARLSREKSDQKVRQFVQGLLARAKVNHEAATPTHTDS